MSGPLVSVVIPCYNSQVSVADAIRSALAQSYSPVEVVVVDDGSTDDSLKVIKSFGDSVRFSSGPNQGAAVARNTGARIANGDLLQFLDADDVLYPNKLEKQVPLALLHRPGMVFCDADVVDSVTRAARGYWRTGSVGTNDPVLHALTAIVQTAGPLHWRETFERVNGFRAHTPPCDDRDLHLRMACAGVAFHHLPEELYQMRRVDGSLSKRDPLGGLRMQRAIGEDAYRALLSNNSLSPTRQAAVAGFVAGTARVAMRYGQIAFAKECFERARSIHPDGGVPQVYSSVGQTLVRLVGPAMTERLAMVKRTLFRNRDIA